MRKKTKRDTEAATKLNTNNLRHDQLFRKAMENPMAAKEFVETYLPSKLLKIADISSLKLEKESYIEPDLTERISDVLFSLKFKGRVGYIYCLLENQSVPDKWMALRLFRYMLNICSHYIENNHKTKKLPLIWPLVVYNGTKPYKVSRNLWELFDMPELAKLFWCEDYQLVNVCDIPDKELKKKVWAGMLQFFMKHIHEREMLKVWEEIGDLLPEIIKVQFGPDYIKLFLHYTLTKIRDEDIIKVKKLLESKVTKENEEVIMRSIAQAWIEKGFEKGIQEGIAQGEARGEARGKTEGKIEVSRYMLSKGYSIAEVSELTGLSIAIITKLKS